MHGLTVSSRIVHALIPLSMLASAGPPAVAQLIWINEFHYDNSGSDTDEFVEIVAPADFTELASVRLTLYNGGDGAPYGSAHDLSSFTPGQVVNGLAFYSKAISGLQNGAPDGFALDLDGSVLHFISYEGSFTATSGPAEGLTSIDVGLSESDTTPAGSSIGLVGFGLSADAFTWASLTASPGVINPGQAAVPEPSEYALCAASLLGGFMLWRRRGRGE